MSKFPATREYPSDQKYTMMFNLYLAPKDNLALDMRLTDTKYNQEYLMWLSLQTFIELCQY